MLNIAGSRPNFMKARRIIDAMNLHPDEIDHQTVHTGQHYYKKLSKTFFKDLGTPKPDDSLGVDSGSHAVFPNYR